MTIKPKLLHVFAFGLVLTGCSGDDTDATATSSGTDTTMGTTTGSTSDATTDSDSATGSTSTGTTTGSTSDTATGSTGEDPFVFDDSPIEDYAQVDRVGMPAINTAVITSKDAYNQDNPEGDAAGTYVAEITANVTALHAALDDDLVGASLVPCAAADCVAQAAPLVVPDTIKVDLTGAAGFPNGRRLIDPVIDVTLAVVLLDLSAMGQDATTLVGILNPAANDVAFDDTFPYLAAPN